MNNITASDAELESYFGISGVKGRRLAESHDEVGRQFIAAANEGVKPCWACRHAFCFRSWRCERYSDGMDCKWESCYTKEDITKEQERRYGNKMIGGWFALPPIPENAEVAV